MSKSNETFNFQQPESEIILIDLAPNLHSLCFGIHLFRGNQCFFFRPKLRPYFLRGVTLWGVIRLTCLLSIFAQAWPGITLETSAMRLPIGFWSPRVAWVSNGNRPSGWGTDLDPELVLGCPRKLLVGSMVSNMVITPRNTPFTSRL